MTIEEITTKLLDVVPITKHTTLEVKQQRQVWWGRAGATMDVTTSKWRDQQNVLQKGEGREKQRP